MFLKLACITAVCAAGQHGWKQGERTPPSTLIDLTIAVKHSPRQLETLENLFWTVSDPQSPRYTDFLSQKEIQTLLRPPQTSIGAIESWLTPFCAKDAPAISTAGDFVSCLVTVQDAEENLLPGSRYFEFTKKIGGNTVSVHRTIPFSLPIKVVEHLDFISPTTRFPVEQKVLKTKSVDQNLRMDPTKIRTLYKIGDVTGTGNPANQLHVAGFLKKFYSPTDLTTFYNFYYPAGKAFAKPKVVGPNDASQPTPEGNLDMQYITSIAANVSSTYWYTDSTVPYPTGINEDFVSWLKALAASTDTLPSVISVSYADEEFVIDPAFQQRCDVEFQKLGVRGASLFFGSGDMGVTGDGGQCHPPNKFVAWWPGSSPFVTSVGAVEEMESQGASFSGGGFSNLYARPAYQDAAVTAYKASEEGKGTPLAFYNQTGAGFPDVSAVGVGFWTYVGGTPDEVGGTSAACPTFAGIVALLNDARMAAGKKALGPLNQLIYQHPEAFTDITDGHNPGHGGCGTDGFACSQGWDPVTGMGTPLYPALLKIAMSLP